MPIGISSSKTKSLTSIADNRNAASDAAIINAPRQSAGKNSSIVGSGATVIRPGGDLSIFNDASPDVLLAALESVSNQAADYNDSLTQIFAANSTLQLASAVANADAQRNLVNQTFDQLADLAEGKQTDGEAGRNQLVLYASMAALATVAAIFIWGKR